MTLVAIVLSAGVVGLLFKVAESGRRTDLAQQTARILKAQLEAEAQLDEPNFQRVMRSYESTVPQDGDLWLVDAASQPITVIVGEPASTLDAGIRNALFSKQEHMEAIGSRLGERHVHITEPVFRGTKVIAALRYSARLDAAGPFGGQWRFFLIYVFASTIGVAGFGFFVFRRRLVQPILAIQEATHGIASGGFGQRVEVEGPRELMELASTLSTLSASLESYRQTSESQLQSLAEANAELKTVQNELIRSEKLAGIGRLAAGIAHEVGNPLAAVVGYVEILISGLEDKELEADILKRSRKELDRIQVIIGDLLDYARPGELPFVAVEIRGLLQEARKRVRLLPRFQKVTVELEFEDDLPDLWLQKEKVHQVLMNLLLNSADAMSGSGTVCLSAIGQEGGIEIQCRDSGAGFDPGHLEKVFDPFFTTKEPGGGTGLGLAISHRIVASQGGTLTAENNPAGGALLRLFLPAVTP